MALRRRLKTLLTDPVGVVRRRLELLKLVARYGRRLEGERAADFWAERHARYGADDLRGVGRESWSHEQNLDDYRRAGEAVLGATGREGVDLPRARVLDIGCGTGFYAGLLRERGVTRYTGVDITDTLFPRLEADHPGFRFVRCDVSREDLPADAGPFDLVLMIDVTQHITSDEGFARVMGTVAERLAPGGRFLVTSWLRGPERLSFYEVARPREAYARAFPAPEFELGEPLPFREKWLLTVRRRASS